MLVQTAVWKSKVTSPSNLGLFDLARHVSVVRNITSCKLALKYYLSPILTFEAELEHLGSRFDAELMCLSQ